MAKYCVLLIFLLIHLSEQKVKVSIYYESLCPDSASFIADQLTRNYDTLKDKINLEFIPYGKATHTFNSLTGIWNFNCQHGERECKLNKYHACALKYSPSQADQLKFVNCMLQGMKDDDETTYQACASKSEIPSIMITNCQRTGEDSALLAHFGDRTNADVPSISFVPTIVFNSRFDQRLHERARTEFLKVVNELHTEDSTVIPGLCYYCFPYHQNYYSRPTIPYYPPSQRYYPYYQQSYSPSYRPPYTSSYTSSYTSPYTSPYSSPCSASYARSCSPSYPRYY